MKTFFVILLAAMTAWVAVTASEMDNAHKAAGRPAKVRSVNTDNPAMRQFHALVKDYGSRQVLFGIVGVVAGLVLALTVVLKVMKLLALGCVAILAVVLWQAWERGYLTSAAACAYHPNVLCLGRSMNPDVREIPLRIQRRRAALAAGRDCLPVTMIAHIARCEDAGHIRRRAPRLL